MRPEYELDQAGKVRGCVNVPVYTAENKYDAAAGKKILKKFPNEKFIAQVEKKLPNKATKLIVACSDGKSYCMEALEALDEAGYENIVALKGGYYAWFRCWDNNLRRRRGDGYTEVRRRVFRTLFSEGAFFPLLIFRSLAGMIESTSSLSLRREKANEPHEQSSQNIKKTWKKSKIQNPKIKTRKTGLRRRGRRLVRRPRHGRRLREDGRCGGVEPARVRLRRVDLVSDSRERRKRRGQFFRRG